NRPGKLLLQLGLILRVHNAVVIGEENDFFVGRQLSQNIVRTDVSSAMHGQYIIGLYPQDSHRVHTSFRLVRKLAKPTTAAVLRTIRVSAALATRASSPPGTSVNARGLRV